MEHAFLVEKKASVNNGHMHLIRSKQCFACVQNETCRSKVLAACSNGTWNLEVLAEIKYEFTAANLMMGKGKRGEEIFLKSTMEAGLFDRASAYDCKIWVLFRHKLGSYESGRLEPNLLLSSKKRKEDEQNTEFERNACTYDLQY